MAEVKVPGRNRGITSETVSLAEFFARSEQSVVPDLQRRVSWAADHFDEFLEDAAAYQELSEETKARYIGAFLIQPRSGDDKPFSAHTKIDGQQRTVVTLIAIANLARMYENRGEDEAAEYLREEFLTITTRNGRKPRVLLTELDNDAFQAILQDPSTSTDHEGLNKLNAAIQESFDERVEDKSDIRSLEKLLVEEQTIVLIHLEESYNQYRLFDQINARGTALTAVDRVKNRILEVADDDSSVDYTAVKEEWHRFRMALEGHNETRALRYILMAGNLVPVTKKLNGSDLFDTVDDILQRRLDEHNVDLEEYVSWLADQGELYSSLATPNYHIATASLQQTRALNRHLEHLEMIGAKPARILLLAAHMRGVSPIEMREIMIAAEMLSFARRVVGLRIPQEVRAYIQAIHGEDGDDDDDDEESAFEQSDVVEAVKERLREEMPSEEAFRREFVDHEWGPRSSITKYALLILEYEYYRQNPGSEFGGPIGSGSIEHIIPYRYNSDKYDKWHSYLDASADELDIDVNRIGNLTLLEERKNIDAQDDPFEQKRTPHYNGSSYAMPQDIAASYTEWGLDQIDERSEELAAEAVNIWSL